MRLHMLVVCRIGTRDISYYVNARAHFFQPQVIVLLAIIDSKLFVDWNQRQLTFQQVWLVNETSKNESATYAPRPA